MTLVLVSSDLVKKVVYCASSLVGTLVMFATVKPVFSIAADVTCGANVVLPNTSGFESVGIPWGPRNNRADMPVPETGRVWC